MFNAEFFSTTNVNGAKSFYTHSVGKYIAINEISVASIAKKNGVELREVAYSTGIDHYELLIDGEFINRFKSRKTAMSMFKDFSA